MITLPFSGSSALPGSPLIDLSNKTATPSSDSEGPIRDVRVLLANNAKRIRIRSDRDTRIDDDRGIRIDSYPADEWIEIAQYHDGRIHIDDVPFKVLYVLIKPEKGGTLSLSRFHNGHWREKRTYAGTMRMRLDNKAGIDVINYVPIEQYVSGVVANEVWPTFEQEAFRVQAIVSRTYVLYQMLRRRKSNFDVSATQGSQVYRGLRTDSIGQKALEATQYTKGIVATWPVNGVDQLFCTYYSAACGGLSQSAAIFGKESDIEPLHGQVACEYCKAAPKGYYRWGPVKIAKKKILSKLTERYKDFSSLSYIESIKITERTPSDRPIMLRITGTGGKSIDILAERFRLRVGGSSIRSTDFSLSNHDNQIVFQNGKGFGHGLGLCQWGAQGLALKGKQTGDILRYYYPGCQLTRVY